MQKDNEKEWEEAKQFAQEKLDKWKEEMFFKFLTNKNPGVDIEKALKIIQEQFDKVTLSGPDDDHPNKELEVPLKSDLVRAVIIASIRDYIKTTES